MLGAQVPRISGARRCCVCICVHVAAQRSVLLSAMVGSSTSVALPTDFDTGDLASGMGWKLNGPRSFCSKLPVLLPLLLPFVELDAVFGLEGLRGMVDREGLNEVL